MVKLLLECKKVKKENKQLPQFRQSSLFFFSSSPRNNIKSSDSIATCFSIVQFIVPQSIICDILFYGQFFILMYSNVSWNIFLDIKMPLLDQYKPIQRLLLPMNNKCSECAVISSILLFQYLYCVATGIPIVDYTWLYDSVEKSTRLDYWKYKLPAGKDITGDDVSQNCTEYPREKRDPYTPLVALKVHYFIFCSFSVQFFIHN